MRKNPYIASLFVVLIFLGMSLSVLHLHNERMDVRDSHQEIVQDHNFCAVCAPHYKFSPVSDLSIEIYTHSETYLYVQTEGSLVSAETTPRNERAPPL